jgi:hypothetical protein
MSDIIEIFGKKHTAHGLNFYLTHFDLLAKCLDRDHYAFLVGGYVRDRIIGKPIDKSVDVGYYNHSRTNNCCKPF